MRYYMRQLYHLLFTLLFLLIFLKPPVSAQDFVRLGKVGEWSNDYGDFRTVDVKEINGVTYAFCATSKGMAVFSMRYENNGQNRTKAKISFISFVPLGYCADIVIKESGGFENDLYAYITLRDRGLYIRNVTDPAFSYHVGSCETPGSAYGIAIAAIGSGEYAFVADWESGLQVIDISDPSGPVIVGSCDTPGSAWGVAIATIGSGEYAFVADWESDLQVIDISDPTGPVIVGSCDTPGDVRGVAIASIGSMEYAFVADGESGLQVIDISDPSGPVIVGSCDTPGYSRGIAIATIGSVEYVFVADGGSGLQVIDIIDPTGPRIVGNHYTTNWVSGFTIATIGSGKYAFVTDWSSGLQVIDISDPTGPRIVGICVTPDDAKKVAIATIGSGDYAFVADYDSGLQVIDISDPTDPRIVSSCDTPGYAQGIAIAAIGSGEYAFVADWESGLQVIDISDPSGPVIVGSCDTPGSAWGVAIATIGSADYAFVLDGDSGLQVIDISDPTDPRIVGSCVTPGYLREIAIATIGSGDYAFVADGNSGLQIIDISDPTDPRIVGSCVTPDDAFGVAIATIESVDYAFVADGDSGLQVIDISDPTAPFIIGSCDTPGYESGVVIATIGSADYAFVTDIGGLQVVDISDPTDPRIVGSCYTPYSAREIAIAAIGSADYAFVVCSSVISESALQVIDISNPTGPRIVGSCDPTGYADSIVIATIGSADYAFMLDYDSGLLVIDISDPTGPRIVGSCDTPYAAAGIAIATIESGYYAFVANEGSGLQVIDISDPTGPRIVGSCDTPGYAWEVAIATIESGHYAFVADDESGLQVIDISAPTGPRIVGSCDTPGYAWEVAIATIESEDYAFVEYSSGWPDYKSGLQVIDISDPTGPRIVGSCDTPGSPWGVTIATIRSGDYAFMVYSSGYPDYDIGLLVIDISDPTGPRIVGSCDTSGKAYGIAIATIGSGDYAFWADGESGLQVIDISNPTMPRKVGSCSTPGYAWGVAIATIGSGDYAFVADGEAGLQILKINIGPPPEEKGNLVLVAGGNINYTSLSYTSLSQQPTSIPMRKRGTTLDLPDKKTSYWQITQALANHVFNTFRNSGYEVYDIYYFNPEPLQDTDNNGIFNQLVVDDPSPTCSGLMDIIKRFPEDQFGNHLANNGPLYIYLVGHGAEDRFHLIPNEIISAQELKTSIEKFQNGYTDDEGVYHPGTDRPVIVLIESGESGTFIDDLVSPSNDSKTNEIIVITSTGSGPSYIKPSPYQNTYIPLSFTSFLMDYLQEDTGIEDYLNSLKEAFILAREQIYQTGRPFLDQAPQMYLPEGPVALTFVPDDPNTPVNPLIINQKKKTALRVIAGYPDGTTITLDPEHLYFLSSQSLVFDPNDPGQIEITSERILILPEKNGLATFIAYPDPDYYPNIPLTARLPLEVSIPGNTSAGGDKAVIVAGYCTNQGIPDSLWEATNTIANHAYMSLRKKGYGREDIFYLSPHFFQDIDDNQRFDDIDGHPTIENLHWSFANIEHTGAQELLLFFVDHGERDHFNINPCNEAFSAQILGDSILSLAPKVKGNINILIEACHSGSFTLPEDQLDDPNDVILITTAGEGESAYFHAGGIVSFSYPFFDQYLLTNSLQGAFDHARFTIPPSRQTPSLCTPGRARKRDRGLVYFIDDACPVITKTEFSRGEGRLSLFVRVYSLSGIKRVWALILSPDQAPYLTETSPGVDAPIIELSADAPNAPYGGWYRAEEVDDPCPDAFNYQILLCAQDKTDKITTQRTNISNRNRDATGVIILVTNPDAMEEDIAGLFDKVSNHVYWVLKEKGIKDDDIYYLKAPGEYSESEVLDEDPNLAAVRDGIPSWLEAKDYDILLIYLLGLGKKEVSGEAFFCLNQKEDLSPEELGSYIHPKQGCRVIFFCDISYAEPFIEGLPFEDHWTGISSSSGSNYYKKYDGTFLPLFSELFFSEISYHPFGQAYKEAEKNMGLLYDNHKWIQNPCVLRLNSSGEIIVFSNVRQRLNFYIGDLLAGGEDPRLIKTAQAWEDGDNIKVELRVNGSAIILPPQADFITPCGGLTSMSLVQDTEDPSLWSIIQGKDQSYSMVIVYVQQSKESGQPGNSDLRRLFIEGSLQGSDADIYEEDDSPLQAWPVVVNNRGRMHMHTFHTDTDTDWVYFFGHAGHQYEMRATDVTECDRFIKLSLADPNGKVLTTEAGIPIQDPYCRLVFQCAQEGYYFLKAEPASEFPGEGIGYTLYVEENQAALPVEDNHADSSASILGRVINSSQEGVNGLRVNLLSSGKIMRNSWTGSLQNVLGNTLDPSKIDGWYFIPNIEPGVYDLSLTGDDPNIILKEVFDITISHGQIKRENIVFNFPGKWSDAAGEFDLVYTQYQNRKGKDYPVWEDNDNDGLTNLEEFLEGTDPDNIIRHMSLPIGWSMISIPVMPEENRSVSDLFPGAEVVYEYKKGTGYKRVQKTERLKVGRGYWILLKVGKVYPLTGQPVDFYNLSVNEDGWEMIGGCTYAARALAEDCSIDAIYGYEQEVGYQRIHNSDDPNSGKDLETGKGYWMLLNDIESQCELTVVAD